MQYDITGTVEFEPFIGDGRAGNIAAQLFELVALIHGAAHRRVEAEALLVDTVLWRILRLNARDGLQAREKGQRVFLASYRAPLMFAVRLGKT